jgi:TPR repeat protein
MKWLKISGEHGYPTEMAHYWWYLLNAIHSYESKEAAFSHFKKTAFLGHTESICRLGVYYELGWGIAKHIFKAIEMYKIATDLGLSDAFLP